MHTIDRTPTNMPWAVYRCDRLGLGQTSANEVFVSGHLSASEAMDLYERVRPGARVRVLGPSETGMGTSPGWAA